MVEAHSSRYSTHPGSTKLYHDLRDIYWWNNMKRDIADYVSRYLNCQQVKAEHQRPGGLAQVIEILEWKLEQINMDFVVVLPRTFKKHDSVWLIVDRLTKSAHFLPVERTYKAPQYATLCKDGQAERTIQILEDMLRACVLDFEGVLSGKIKNFTLNENGVMRLDGRLFVPNVDDLRKAIMVEAHSSRYSTHPGYTKMYHDLRDIYWWNNMKRDIADYVSRYLNCQQVKAKHQRPAFHPQMEGQAERTIQILEDMLRACVLDFKGNWDDHLPLIEFAYNNSYQASIQMGPFEALYGRQCRFLVGWFEIGETKLIGPNIVQDALKKFHNPSHVLDRQEIEIDDTLTYEEVPVAILDRQDRRPRTKDVASVKVIWRNHLAEEATWEPKEAMKKKYPYLFEISGT
ncbi:PREDICTED: uncharacterized protein LOC109219182 [Nicotiana attenuata]|uniref:uncharacterized protein LOC109219182 n=1 Tax=Nicotiana attenuata TaxID=49451 RepID=UPI000905BE19|nr:PREDICTED: uncharacterized protein LOC109219182 [Nicotiana attenuata]